MKNSLHVKSDHEIEAKNTPLTTIKTANKRTHNNQKQQHQRNLQQDLKPLKDEDMMIQQEQNSINLLTQSQRKKRYKQIN